MADSRTKRFGRLMRRWWVRIESAERIRAMARRVSAAARFLVQHWSTVVAVVVAIAAGIGGLVNWLEGNAILVALVVAVGIAIGPSVTRRATALVGSPRTEPDDEREKVAIRRSADGMILPDTEITSDGVPWVWDGERARARCPEHPDTELQHRANGQGGATSRPADHSSLLESHEHGGHLFCREHADDRRLLGESKTYGEARHRAENAMRAATRTGRGRSVFDATGGRIDADGVRARNQDTVFRTEGTDVTARNIDAE